MKKITTIFSYSLLAFLLLIVCVGCQNDIEEVVPTEGRSVMMEVSVSTVEATRAMPTDAEKKINSLRVYAFRGMTLVGYLYRQEVLSAGEPFYIDLLLPESGTYDVDFYVIANENEMAYENVPISLSGNATRSELEAIKYTGLISGNALPMYCRQSVAINVDNITELANSVAGHEGHLLLVQKAELLLSRSLSKLSFYAAKEQGAVSNPQILSVSLLAGGTREYSYLFPQGDDILNAVPSRNNNRSLFAATASITKSIDKTNAEARADVANYDEVFSGAYMPEVVYGSSEWHTSSGNEREAVLHIEYTLGEGQELHNGYVYLPPIMRNHHIKVCTFINAEGQIIITYTVAPWDDNTSSVYTFAYPTHSYLRESIPTSQEELVVKPSQSARMSATEPFVGYFQMTAPDSDSWTPTLLGLNAINCNIRVYEANTTISVPESSFPIEASDLWYRVEVYPEGGKMSVGEEVQLAITYTAIGLENRNFMLINGSYLEYYWPYEGASVQDANYVIITMVN